MSSVDLNAGSVVLIKAKALSVGTTDFALSLVQDLPLVITTIRMNLVEMMNYITYKWYIFRRLEKLLIYVWESSAALGLPKT